MNIKDFIAEIPDFPNSGIAYKCITPILQDPKAFRFVRDQFLNYAKELGVQKIAGIDSRGFIFGSPVAIELGIPFVLVRKAGKLPKECHKESYDLEYGSAEVEMQKDDIKEGEKILIIDDLIATGGTIEATKNIIEKAGAVPSGVGCVIELEFLKGRDRFGDVDVLSLVQY